MSAPYLEKAYELAKELNAAKDIKDTITDHLPGVLGTRYCSLFIRNPYSGELEIKAHNHPDIGQDPFIHVDSQQKSIMNLVVSSNRSLIIHDIEEEMGIKNKEKYSTKSFIYILINRHDASICVFQMCTND